MFNEVKQHDVLESEELKKTHLLGRRTVQAWLQEQPSIERDFLFEHFVLYFVLYNATVWVVALIFVYSLCVVLIVLVVCKSPTLLAIVYFITEGGNRSS